MHLHERDHSETTEESITDLARRYHTHSLFVIALKDDNVFSDKTLTDMEITIYGHLVKIIQSSLLPFEG